ncbi:hypothetical protein [Sinomonas halotolerans]|uniref:DUF2019 domain-containing protein n=1 Tax=Sinomonas halotolerans TaxID=1644133 RepID=A0ABU9X162_9MICC
MRYEEMETLALLNEFEEKAKLWGDLIGHNARKANRLFSQLDLMDKELRRSPEGRSGMEGLLSHDSQGVRLLASTACLYWNPEIGVAALEQLASEPGLHASSAKYTLKAFHDGTLNLE